MVCPGTQTASDPDASHISGYAGQVMPFLSKCMQYRYEKNVIQKSNQNLETIIETEAQAQTKSIRELRKEVLEGAKQMSDKIALDRTEIEQYKNEARSKLSQFITLKNDRETKTFLFESYEKIQVPAKNFETGEIVEGKMITKYNFRVYDVTDSNNENPELYTWQRGMNEATQVLDYLAEEKAELTIKRNGRPNDQKTFYTIYPASR